MTLLKDSAEGEMRNSADAAAPPAGSFAGALISDGPSPELGKAAEDFDWLMGGWSAEVRDFDPDGRVRQGKGEWWFAWVLEGRAIQDVWIVPPRAERPAKAGRPADGTAASNRYGTTVRWLDAKNGQWRIVWVDPENGVINTLTGSRKGDRIVLVGQEDGHAIRWSFNEIRPDSFTWRGEREHAGEQWTLEAEFRLKRMK